MNDTPRTDAAIETWLRVPTPTPPEFIALARHLERELTAAQKDAERYRWLRDEGVSIEGIAPIRRNKWLDAAIDAAIAAEKPLPPA